MTSRKASLPTSGTCLKDSVFYSHIAQRKISTMVRVFPLLFSLPPPSLPLLPLSPSSLSLLSLSLSLLPLSLLPLSPLSCTQERMILILFSIFCSSVLYFFSATPPNEKLDKEIIASQIRFRMGNILENTDQGVSLSVFVM